METNDSPDIPHFTSLAIEGVIGVGQDLAVRSAWGALRGRAHPRRRGGEPFPSRFYEDRGLHAFQTQLWFLLSRYRQLSEAGGQQNLFHRVTISDYLFAKDRIFAALNLDGDELQLYNRVAGILEAVIRRPTWWCTFRRPPMCCSGGSPDADGPSSSTWTRHISRASTPPTTTSSFTTTNLRSLSSIPTRSITWKTRRPRGDQSPRS